MKDRKKKKKEEPCNGLSNLSNTWEDNVQTAENGTRTPCTLATVHSLGSGPIAELKDWALESASLSAQLPASAPEYPTFLSLSFLIC